MSKLWAKELLLAWVLSMWWEALAENRENTTRVDLDQLNHRVELAQANTKEAIDSGLTTLEEKTDPNAFDESEFRLDLKEYLWDQAKLFAEMPSDKKNIFANTLTQILRDNGKMYSRHFPKSDTYRDRDTLESIQFLMRDYVIFLHNLDFKLFDAVPFYESLLSNFLEIRERWLKVDDGIMYTLYGMKSFAEQVDFYRNEVLSKPGVPSEKYVKELQRVIQEIARHDENIARHDENIARHDENIAQNREEINRLRAERETLLLVKQMIESMSSVK